MFYDLLRAPSLCVIWAPKCPFVRYCKSYFDRASPYTRCESELQLLRTITWWVHFSLCTLYEKNIATSIKVDFSEFLLSSHICTLKNPCITYCAGTPQKDTTLPMKNWTKLFSHCTEALFRIISFFFIPILPNLHRLRNQCQMDCLLHRDQDRKFRSHPQWCPRFGRFLTACTFYW